MRVTFDEPGNDGPDGKIFFYSNEGVINPDCDPDDDGIPNHLDTDSDGGGIDDVIEVGGVDEDGDGQWDGEVDENGVPIGANGGVSLDNVDGYPYEAADDVLQAFDDSSVTSENASVLIPVLSNDTDPQNDNLTITGVSDPGIGAVILNGGDISFDPLNCIR